MWLNTMSVISIEKVINSRCSCDSDGNPKKFHWGSFINEKIPSKKEMKLILSCCNIPKFSKGKLLSRFEDNYLFLGFEKTNNPFQDRLLHIESGMQQEAAYLACTVLDLGTCITNLGINGTEQDGKILTVKLLEMILKHF